MVQKNKRAWMTGQLYTAWVRELDRKFAREKRKVLLFVDNCPAHPVVKDLKSITVNFFPPNATSYVQPMDQGVIHCCKLYYRKHLIERKLAAMDKKQEFNINLAMAMSWLRRAWGKVKKDTIEKCFRKAGFINSEMTDDHTETADVTDADDLLDDLPLCELKKSFNGQYPRGIR
ncbi:hypothetical protein FSP39_016336 [Pinctada imbricata]|uniref:DDE-1 domain-containing protein n=1 Tax=Pinctada imbricata TaxID=66713 RepID=A0AA88XGV5_PINIB|nr:hypothetical protein FSP39_016336 [Pinctada imbricata]